MLRPTENNPHEWEVADNVNKRPARMHMQALFERSAPLHIDVGSGKGRMLTEPVDPSFNMLGLEKRRQYASFTAQRLQKRQLPNARVICTDAAYFITSLVEDASVDRYSILFPDPWHKKRHKKRRVVQQAFLTELWRTLKPGGLIWVATDHLEYFTFIQEQFARFERYPEVKEDAPPAGITHFEIKYVKQLRPIYRTAYRRP